ncbi:MAG: DUF1016 domain-containing protein [Bacteroidales bacterium]|jgi:hypothetical protein|nr:DUF1016 domain-containing protein [Bacteroidales bacterium]
MLDITQALDSSKPADYPRFLAFLQPLVGEISWSKHLVIMSKCKEKKRTIVEYALKDSKKPIGVATYNLSATLPDAYKDLLPPPEIIAKKLINFADLRYNYNI